MAAPLLVHVVAGVRRMWLRGMRGRGGSLRMRLHRVTGYFLLAVIFGHVLAVRGPSLFATSTSTTRCSVPRRSTTASTARCSRSTRSARAAAVPGGARLGLGVPVGVGTALVVLALLALGGRLFPIADPRESRYAKMWEGRFGVELGR